MSYIDWFIKKCCVNGSIIVYYNIKRSELGIYDKHINRIIKKFVVNIDEVNDLLNKFKVNGFYTISNEFKLIDRW